MTKKKNEEISKISQEFAGGFKDTFETINNTGWLIVDPLSGYLNYIGFENKLHEIPANEKHPQVLTITFNDGSIFIPAGRDLKPIIKTAKNWMWCQETF